MLHYGEPAQSSITVSLTLVPYTQDQAPITESLPKTSPPQSHLDWTIDEDFGNLLYKGTEGEICIPDVIWMGCDAAFAQGFHCGRALMLEREDGQWNILTDQEFTQLITQHLPVDLPALAIDRWKRGFIFGWCMTWYYQLFLVHEEIDASSEDESEAASCKGMY
jgi:hypothetical protein